jgi:hypothetical protein
MRSGDRSLSAYMRVSKRLVGGLLAVAVAAGCGSAGSGSAGVSNPISSAAGQSASMAASPSITASTTPTPQPTPTPWLIAQPLPAYFRNWKPGSSVLKDSNGVAMKRYRAPLGKQYTPTQVAQVALEYYDRWLVDKDEKSLASDKAAFLVQINWLLANQQADGRWLFNFKWGRMKSPWWSAMTEGLAMSALLRAYSITGDPACLTAITRARTTFERDRDHDHGVAAPISVGSAKYIVYEEYLSAYAEPNVLNGWIFSLIGLYETATYLHDQSALADLMGPDRGFAALKALLPYYNTGNWSFYYITSATKDRHGRYDTKSYHVLVIGQLTYLAQITGDSFFTKWADKFTAYLNACEKAGQCPPKH